MLPVGDVSGVVKVNEFGSTLSLGPPVPPIVRVTGIFTFPPFELTAIVAV